MLAVAIADNVAWSVCLSIRPSVMRYRLAGTLTCGTK